MTGFGRSESEKKHTDRSPEPEHECHGDPEENRADPKLVECPIDRSNRQPHQERPHRHNNTWP